jgi:hypothetical protein
LNTNEAKNSANRFIRIQWPRTRFHRFGVQLPKLVSTLLLIWLYRPSAVRIFAGGKTYGTERQIIWTKGRNSFKLQGKAFGKQ